MAYKTRILIGILALSGCAKSEDTKSIPYETSRIEQSQTTHTSPAAVVSLPAIIDQPAAAVNKVLGKPRKTTKITSSPEQMPGEFRDYERDGTEEIVVRFHRGTAVHVTVYLSTPAATAREALAMAGLDEERAALETYPAAEKWMGLVGGTAFNNVRAIKEDGGWTIVQAQSGADPAREK